MIVSNTSPLYYLHQIGCVDVMRDLFGTVYTTPQVVAELNAGKRQGLDIPKVSEIEWIIIRDIAVPLFVELIPDLGKGEASVVALAIENPGSYVIIDDRLGREVAKAQKIHVTGTLGVLLQAKQSGVLQAISPLISQLRQAGFYCSKPVESEILRLANEP
jgi:predicted nucleic acid-binding protein